MADEDVRLGVGDAQGLGLGACEVVLNAESISAAKHFFQQLDVVRDCPPHTALHAAVTLKLTQIVHPMDHHARMPVAS
jgi:hypothetical protein